MIKVDFSNHTRKFKVKKRKLFDIVNRIAEIAGVDNGSLSLSFVGEKRIRQINRDFRKKDSATNVISFPFMDVVNGKRLLGDIVICPLVAKKQALKQGNNFNDYMAFLIIHGFLHLLGYDHIKEKDRIIMEKKEEEIFNKLDIDTIRNFIKEVDIKK